MTRATNVGILTLALITTVMCGLVKIARASPNTTKGCKEEERKKGNQSVSIERTPLRLNMKPLPKLAVGQTFQVHFSFESNPGLVSQSEQNINTFFHDLISLTLVNINTGEKHDIRVIDVGMLLVDLGARFVPLRDNNEEYSVSFSLANHLGSVTPGKYTYQLNYNFNLKMREHDKHVDWKSKKFWQGKIKSEKKTLDIIEPELIPKEIVVPTNLIVVPGSRIKQPAGETVTLHLVFTKSQSEKIVVDIKKGYHIGHTTYLNGQMRQQGGGLPTFGKGDDLSSWYNHQSGGLSKRVTVKIFETANPPGHFWQTGKAYRILWEKSFNIDYSEEDIEKLKMKLDES